MSGKSDSVIIGALRSLEPNWDSYGAPAIDERAIRVAAAILSTPASVTPTCEGGVQIEWHCGGIDLEFEINPDGSADEILCQTCSSEGDL